MDELFDRNVIVTGTTPASIGVRLRCYCCIIYHSLLPLTCPLPDPSPQPSASGIDAVKRFVVDLRCGFPNMVFAIEDIAYENANVICRWRGKVRLSLCGRRLFVCRLPCVFHHTAPTQRLC